MQEEARSIRELLESLAAEAAGEAQLTQETATEAWRTAVTRVAEAFYRNMLETEAQHVEQLRAADRDFRNRSYHKWQRGFDMLAILRQTSIAAGELFQEEFLRHPQFVHDPLLGVLMRLHAHACRVLGEIEALMLAGYADAAHARWRTLHEIAVTSILIREHGRNAAIDFVRYGILAEVDGMEGYQETAQSMGREPYSDEELQEAQQVRDRLMEHCDDGARSTNHGWARKYVGSSKFFKLQQAAGLEKWANDYKAASRSVHFAYRDMRSLLAMSEANEDMLLCGPSNSGMTLPAHCSAIALVQTTGAYLNGYVEAEGSPIDYSLATVMLSVLGRMADDVGDRFMTIQTAIEGTAPSRPDETK